MVVIGYHLLRAFAEKHPKARKRLELWQDNVKASNWKHLADLKRTYQQTDGGVKAIHTIFNLGPFRVVAQIDFKEQQVTVVAVFTHDEYERWSDK